MRRRTPHGLISTRAVAAFFVAAALLGVGIPGSTLSPAFARPAAQDDADGRRADLQAKFKQIGDLFNAGEAALAHRDYAKAEQLLTAAYDAARGTGDRVSIGIMLDALGGVLAERGDTEEAIEKQKQAVEILRTGDDKRAYGRSLINIAVSYQAVGQTEKAIQSLTASVEVWRGLTDLGGEAAALRALGDYQKDAGHFGDAINTLQEATRMREHINAGPRALAECHGDLGNTLCAAGRFADARKEYEAAIQLAGEAQDDQLIASVLTNIGATEADSGDFTAAMESEQKALGLREKSPDPEAIAHTLGSAAAVCFQCAHYDQALFYDRRALSIAESTGSKPLQAEDLTNLGITYDAMGQRSKATESLLRAVDMYDQTGNHVGEANAIFNLGYISLGAHDYPTALTFFGRSLPIAEQSGDAAWLAQVETAIGIAEDESGNPDAALPMFEKAHDYYVKAKRPQDLARSFNSLGAIYRSLKRYDEATAAFTQALEIDKQYGNPSSLAIVQSNLGSIYIEQQDWAKSATLFEAAITSAEAVRDQVANPADIGAMQQGNVQDVYRRYASVLLHMGKTGDALCAIESGRGQGLARQAIQSRTDWKAVLPETDAKNLEQAVDALRRAQTEVDAVESDAEHASILATDADDQAVATRVDEARRLRDEAQSALAKLRDNIAAREPRYRTLCGLDKPSVDLFTKLAKDHPDTLYLSWTAGIGETLLFAVRSDFGVREFTLPVGELELRKLIDEWRAAILPKEIGGSGADMPAERNLAQRVYTTLFGNIDKAGLLTGAQTKRLVVLGDGPVRDLPFAAVIGADGKRLIERLPLSTGISLRMLAASSAGHGDGRPVGRGILCMADPFGDQSNAALADLIGGELALPASRAESQSIADLYGDGATRLFGAAATRDAILPQLSTARLLHFSTHGYLDDEEGLRSGLLIALPPAKPDPDGDADVVELPLLTAEDILRQPLAADLTTLSACETGQGSRGGGDGLLGLVWAFHAAGCPSVIASQWSVTDGSTALLMVKFYQCLRSGMRRDDALQQAMLAVERRAGELSAPFFWAAFQLSGEAGALPASTTPAASK